MLFILLHSLFISFPFLMFLHLAPRWHPSGYLLGYPLSSHAGVRQTAAHIQGEDGQRRPDWGHQEVTPPGRGRHGAGRAGRAEPTLHGDGGLVRVQGEAHHGRAGAWRGHAGRPSDFSISISADLQLFYLFIFLFLLFGRAFFFFSNNKQYVKYCL